MVQVVYEFNQGGEVVFRGEKIYIMGFIHCCGGKRKTESYTLLPAEGFQSAEMDFLQECPVCGHTVLQLTRIDFKGNISLCRKTNEKARKLFNKLKNNILHKGKNFENIQSRGSKFYLYYNEYGVKKKCFSNLSSLKLGKFDTENYDKYQSKLNIQLSD